MTPSDTLLPVGYDLNLVVVSILIAALAAYISLTLAERIVANGSRNRYLWLSAGAVTMGGGIWSMHFTGMLALQIPLAVMYDVPIVGLSLLAAVAASGIALYIVTRPEMPTGAWLLGGALIGSGIAGMHYLGMAAMRVCAQVRWNVAIIGLSLIVAVAVSLVALRIIFSLRATTNHGGGWRRVGAASLIGCAIAGLHYTGMAAASFIARPNLVPHGLLIGQRTVYGSAMLVASIIVMTAVVIVAVVDRHLARQQALITQQQDFLRTIVSTAPIILIALDRVGNVIVAEGRDLPALGQDAQSMIGRAFLDIFAGQPFLCDQATRALAGESHHGDVVIRGIALDLRWTALRDAAGEVCSVIAVAIDISDRRNSERALRHHTLNDPLTDLPNRTAMHERLTEMLVMAEEWEREFALALIDLDRFKEVNDTLGHAVGDELLTSVARRIDAVMTQIGIVDGAFRIGGDEFVLFLPGRDAEAAMDIARSLLTELARPQDVAGFALDVHASIGLAVYPAQATDGQTLLRCADVAMYVAKETGAGCAVYDPGHDRHSATLLALEADMRRAISEGGFELYYQPQFDMSTGCIKAAEALLRWHHPTLGFLPPDRFIPIAEETGLIIPLTDWVLEHALQQIRAWSDAGSPLTVAVNVSMRSLREEAFPETVAALLTRYGVPPERLVIEVTETIVMIDDRATRAAFERLTSLGTELSIDDFGTGYSSLAYLKRLPVDELKIDKSFILGLADAESKDAELVRLIIDLGHNLGLRVVAEGVENQDILDILAALGCDIAQGYHISRPMPASAFATWLPSMKSAALSNVA